MLNSMIKVAEGARICGATKIIGVDINPEKFELGKHYYIQISD